MEFGVFQHNRSILSTLWSISSSSTLYEGARRLTYEIQELYQILSCVIVTVPHVLQYEQLTAKVRTAHVREQQTELLQAG